MRKALAYIVLLAYMNFLMFTPSIDERDRCFTATAIADDINSMYEYFDEILLNHIDSSPDDEDGNQTHDLQVSTAAIYYYKFSCYEIISPKSFAITAIRRFCPPSQQICLRPFVDIISPPPEV